MDTKAQAWFLKKTSGFGKSQRRFFVLDGSSLCYYAKADGTRGVDRKGTINITGSSLAQCKGKDLSISVHGRTYHLQADSPETAKQWQQHLTAIINAMMAGSASRTASISSTASTATSRGMSMSKSTAIRTGWFVKKAEKVGKNQRRWFELFSSEIKYFAKQAEGRGKDAKGKIPLSAAVQVSHNDPELTIFTPSRTFYLVSEEAGVAQLWAQDIDKHTPAILRKSAADTATSSPTSSQQPRTSPASSSPHRATTASSSSTAAAAATAAASTAGGTSGDFAGEDEGGRSSTRPPISSRRSTVTSDTWAEGSALEEIGNSGMYSNPYFHSSTNDSNTAAAATGDHGDNEHATPQPSTATTTATHQQQQTGAQDTAAQLERTDVQVNEDFEAPASARATTTASTSESNQPRMSVSLGSDLATESLVDVVGSFAGWLTKHADGLGKSRKRFFVLEGATISYYEDNAGEHSGSGLKGAVNLGAKTSVSVDGKNFQILQSNRTWRLTAPSPEEAAAWKQHIDAAVQRLLSGSSATGPSSTSSPAAKGTTTTTADGSLCGWFKKKADKAGRDQERFFVLRSSQIDYFVKEDNGAGRGAKGSISLLGDVGVATKGTELLLYTPERMWQLSADAEQCRLWKQRMLLQVATLKDYSAQQQQQQQQQASSGAAPTSSATAASSSAATAQGTSASASSNEYSHVTELRGWFRKKAAGVGGTKMRYFVLEDSVANPVRIAYYADANDDGTGHDLKGDIAVSNILRVQADGASTLTIHTPSRGYVLESGIPSQVSEWAGVLSNLLTSTHRQTFAGGAAWAEDMDEDSASAHGGRGGTGDEPVLTSWLTKKASGVGSSKRRYFVLRGNEVVYFAEQGEHGHGLNRIGSIDIGFRTKVTCEDLSVYIVNPDRTWVLVADERGVALRWHQHLTRLVASLNVEEGFAADGRSSPQQSMHSDVEGEEDLEDDTDVVDMLPRQGVWLTKKAGGVGRSKSRFFKLVFSMPRQEMQLRYYASLRDGVPTDCKGKIVLESPNDIKSTTNHVVITTTHRTWHLVAKSQQEAMHWASMWTDAMLQHREGRKALNNSSTGGGGGTGAFMPSPASGRVPLNVRLQQLVLDETLTRDSILLTLRTEYGQATVDAAQAMVGDALTRKMKEEHGRPDLCGWLIKAAHKRGQKKSRFFELRGSVVRYFAEEQEGRGAGEKGFFVIGEESDVVCSDMNIEIVNTDRTWSLYASSAHDAQAWAKALLAARGKPADMSLGTDAYDGDDVLATEAEVPLPALGSDWVVKSGQGRMAGDKRRFVVPVYGTSSRKLKLKYYARNDDSGPADPKGYILLSDPDTIVVEDAAIIIATDARHWRLRASSDRIAEGLADGWRQGVRAIAAHDGTPVGSGGPGAAAGAVDKWKLPLYVRGNELLAQHRDEDDMMRILESEYPPEELSAGDSVLQQLLNMARLQQMQEQNHTAAISGWFVKKAQRRGKDRKRFFQLYGTDVHYYVDAKDDQGVMLKGTVSITPSAEITSEGTELRITTGGRTWRLIGDSEMQAEEWVEALMDARQRSMEMQTLVDAAAPGKMDLPATPNDAGPHGGSGMDTGAAGSGDGVHRPVGGSEPEINMTLGPGVWLDKQGEGVGRITGDKKRYFEMLYGGKSAALKLCYFAGFKDGPVDRKGEIKLHPNSEISIKNRVIYLTLPGRRWKLTADTAKAAKVAVSQWRQILLDLRDFGELPTETSAHKLPLAVRVYELAGSSMSVEPEQVETQLLQEYAEEVVTQASDFVQRVIGYHKLFGQHSEPTVTGWFVKKAKRVGSSQRRFFELVDNTVNYFVDCADGRGVDWKGSIPISPRTHLKQQLKNIIIANPDRSWDLMAENVEAAQEWVTALRASKKDAENEAKATDDLMARMGFTESAAVPEDAEDASTADRAGWFHEIDDVFGQETKRFYALFGDDRNELLVYKGVRDGQPYCRTHTHLLSPDMAISVVEKMLTVVSPKWTLQLEAPNAYQATDFAGAMRAVRRLMRAADADYRRKREAEAQRVRMELLAQEEAERDKKKQEAKEIAEKVRKLQEKPLHPDNAPSTEEQQQQEQKAAEGGESVMKKGVAAAAETTAADATATPSENGVKETTTVAASAATSRRGTQVSRRLTTTSQSGAATARVDEVELEERHKAVAPPEVLDAGQKGSTTAATVKSEDGHRGRRRRSGRRCGCCTIC